MRTPQWIKKLGGHGELFVCAELSKRGIPNALLPENFSDDDVLIGNKQGTKVGFVQMKACHPDRSASFIFRETDEKWFSAPRNQFCVLWVSPVAHPRAAFQPSPPTAAPAPPAPVSPRESSSAGFSRRCNSAGNSSPRRSTP
jgi:hypothetical protein